MTLQELLLQRDEIGSAADLIDKVSSDPDFKKSLEAIYLEMFGKKLNNACSNCWNDAYVEILSKTRHGRQFQLRAGAILEDTETGVVYNQHNISDRYAIKHLKQHPESLDLFVDIPEHIDVLLEADSI